METYKELYEKAKKKKALRKITPELYKFEKEGDVLIGAYVSQARVGVSAESLGYNQYIFETDDGMVKFGPGRGFDADAADVLTQGVIYAVTYLGQVKTSSKRTVNKYDIVEIGMAEYSETQPGLHTGDGD